MVVHRFNHWDQYKKVTMFSSNKIEGFKWNYHHYCSCSRCAMCRFCSPPNQIAPYGWQGYDSSSYIRKSVIYSVYELYVHLGLVTFIDLIQKYWCCVLWHRCPHLPNKQQLRSTRTPWKWKKSFWQKTNPANAQRTHSSNQRKKKCFEFKTQENFLLTHKPPTTSSTYPIHTTLSNNDNYRSVVEEVTFTHLKVLTPLCKRPGS